MKKKLFSFLFIPFAIVAVLWVGVNNAEAAPFALPQDTGYFNGNHTNAGQLNQGLNLFDDGTQQTDVESFIAHYHQKLFQSTPKDAVGAGFTILTMLGYPARTALATVDEPINQTVFNHWADLVRYYNSQNRITWIDTTYTYHYNTYYFPEATTWGDIAWYPDDGGQPSIVFRSPNGTAYAIKRDCGNPVGDLSALVDKPAIVLQCGNMLPIDPPKPEAGDNVTVTVTATYIYGPPQGVPSGTITVSGIGPVPIQPPITSTGGTNGTLTMVSKPFKVSSVGSYAVGWTMSVDGQSTPSCGGDINLTGDTFSVFNYPYFNAVAGDVAAGSRFATDTVSPGNSCGSSNNNAGIVSWNKGAPTYNGASGQYGLSAPNYIQDLISSKGNNNGGSQTTLSFANEGTGNPNSITTPGLYGGFNSKGPCVDYWAAKPASGTGPIGDIHNVNLGALGSGTYVYVVNSPAQVTIHRSQLQDGTHITLYVDGDVSIDGDITDKTTDLNGTWSSIRDIPSFKLVAKGVIYIGANVNEIDGNIIAVPDTGYEKTTNRNTFANPMKGTISTCSDTRNFKVYDPSATPAQPMLDACNNKLVFYGTVAAYQMFLLRTYGSMNNSTPAEQFNLSPEVWLAPDNSGTLDPAYKSIVGLPPVL